MTKTPEDLQKTRNRIKLKMIEGVCGLPSEDDIKIIKKFSLVNSKIKFVIFYLLFIYLHAK